MKSLLIPFLALLLSGCSSGIPAAYTPKEGDIVFQSLPHAPLVDSIEGVTLSSYSHCGIVVQRDGKWWVLEAIGPVKETHLDSWIGRGRGSLFSAFRLQASLESKIPRVISEARSFLGQPYDIHYRFDDERIYCSELIYKAVKNATGIGLGKIEKLGDLNWKPHEAFIKSIEGYVPMDREMITPRALSEAKELIKVYDPQR